MTIQKNRWKKVIPVWNNTIVSKWWQNFHFWLKHAFNSSVEKDREDRKHNESQKKMEFRTGLIQSLWHVASFIISFWYRKELDHSWNRNTFYSEYTQTLHVMWSFSMCEELNYVSVHKSFIIWDSQNRAINKTHPITSSNKTCHKQSAPTLFPNQPWWSMAAFLFFIEKRGQKYKKNKTLFFIGYKCEFLSVWQDTSDHRKKRLLNRLPLFNHKTSED